MNKVLPELKKQIHVEDIINLFEHRYSEVSPIWMPMQLEWLNAVYRTFHDYEKFMIIMHLIGKTFQFYSLNFIKLLMKNFLIKTKLK